MLEILRKILKEDGILSLYKGLKTALVGTVVSYGIYFWWYRFMKNFTSSILKRSDFTKLEMTFITAVAGSFSSIFANPIWMVNARQAAQKTDSFV